jgi:hypothetical protein
MDPRGGKTDALAAAGGLNRLSEATGVGFPALEAARKRSAEGLVTWGQNLAGFPRDEDAAVVFMGSWGRLEVTEDSDNDFMCLIDGPERDEGDVRPTIEEIWAALGSRGKRPGAEDVFGVPVFSENLTTIGLEDDGNKNLTRRLLLLLESTGVLGDRTWRRVKAQLLDAYLQGLTADFRPPRFLLNDVIRYWRTIAVDVEAKHRHRHGEEWGLRNAKLRTSRPMLFASGLLPVLECHRLEAGQFGPFLSEQFDAVPTDRIAACFLRHRQSDAGARALAAYESFVAMLDDGESRKELESLSSEERRTSGAYQEAKRLGEEIQAALLSLLLDTAELYPLVREYAIF